MTMTTQEETDKTIEMVRRLYAEAMGHDDIMVSNNVVFEWAMDDGCAYCEERGIAVAKGKGGDFLVYNTRRLHPPTSDT